MDEHIEIPLAGGHVTLIDAADRELVMAHHWIAQRARHTWYARQPRGAGYLHRLLMNAPDGVLVDHRNRDGLDNRRANLRLATVGQNNGNAALRVDNTSGYKGVCWDKRRGNWIVHIARNGRMRYLGAFDDPTEGARAYDAAAREQWGEFALLNNP